MRGKRLCNAVRGVDFWTGFWIRCLMRYAARVSELNKTDPRPQVMGDCSKNSIAEDLDWRDERPNGEVCCCAVLFCSQIDSVHRFCSQRQSRSMG